MPVRVEIAFALLLTGLGMSPTEAHEFWIEGSVIEDSGASELVLDLKVGQMLEGTSLPYLPNSIESFSWIAGGEGAINGMIGDTPAARVPFDPEAGATIFHRTKPRRLEHHDWQKFLEYLELENLDRIAEQHQERGLPKSGFTETYTRHAKLAVVPRGVTRIFDDYQGSPLEFILLDVDVSPNQVELKGQLLSNTGAVPKKINVFRETSGGTKRTELQTDGNGKFAIVLPEPSALLVNAVTMKPVISDGWHSDWASLFVEFNYD